MQVCRLPRVRGRTSGWGGLVPVFAAFLSGVAAGQQWVASGPVVPEMQAFEDGMKRFMQNRGILSGSLAVTRQGKLLYARGFDYTTAAVGTTTPDSLFRIASLSKMVTAVGTLQLVDRGLIGLDQPLNTILDMSGWLDPRAQQLTVRHLLQHTGGWDRSVPTVPESGSTLPGGVYDPLFADALISQSLGRPLPTDPQMIADYMQEMRLVTAPGAGYAYSNFGYLLAGLVIEQITGLDYESYILREVFGRVGAARGRVTSTVLGQQVAGEVTYEDPQARTAMSVMGSGQRVPLVYGGFNLGTAAAAGGWVLTPSQYARFLAAFDDPTRSPLLSAAMIQEMYARNAAVFTDPQATWYGLGVVVEPSGDVWHNGALDPGTSTYQRRRSDGVTFVAMFNRFPQSPNAISRTMANAVTATSLWPTQDLFDLGGAFSTFHVGCAGSAGEPGIRQLSGTLPRLGNALGLELTHLPVGPSHLAFLTAQATAPAPLSLGPLAPGCSLLGSWSLALPVSSGNQLSLPIPAAATALVGRHLYLQGAVTDAVNPLGVVFTRGADALIGQ